MVYQFSDLNELSLFIGKQKNIDRYLELCEQDKVKVKIDDEMFTVKDIKKMIKEGKI